MGGRGGRGVYQGLTWKDKYWAVSVADIGMSSRYRVYIRVKTPYGVHGTLIHSQVPDTAQYLSFHVNP